MKSSLGDYITEFMCAACNNSRQQNQYVPNVNVSSFKIGNITFNNVKGYSIVHSDYIKFYPYVQMAYDRFDSGNDNARVVTEGINVLAQHESAIRPVEYVEIGWYNPKPSESLVINSNMWSTHVRAVNAHGKIQYCRVVAVSYFKYSQHYQGWNSDMASLRRRQFKKLFNWRNSI